MLHSPRSPDPVARLRSLLAMGLALLFLAAIATASPTAGARPGPKDQDWPQYYGGPDHNNYRKVKDKIRVPRVLWHLDNADVLTAVPAAVGQDVYAGGASLRLVDLESGQVKASWKPEKAGKKFHFPGTPVVLKDRVIVHASDGQVRALNRGLTQVLWSRKVEGLGRSFFSGTCNGEAYVVAAGNRVVALDVNRGQVLWTFEVGARAEVQMAVAIAEGHALFGAMDGRFFSVDMKKGKKTWVYRGPKPFGHTNPVAAFGKVFVGDRGGCVNALDLKKGTLAWRWESGATGLSTPGVIPGCILVGFSRFVTPIDVKTGKPVGSRKRFATDYNPFGSPTLIDRTLYFGNLDGHLYAFDFKRETFKWAFEVGKKEQVLDFIYHRNILLVSTTGGLYALGNDPKKRKLPSQFVLRPAATPVAPVVRDKNFYVNDVQFALKNLGEMCGRFFRLKNIDWKNVSREFLAEARKVATDQEHLVLLVRLVARLKDGHAGVQPLEDGKKVKWPDDGKGEQVGPGMFWCRIQGKIYVKNAWSAAAGSGIKSGMEVLTVDGKPATGWLEAKIAELSDLISFSTPQQAFFFGCHWGLAGKKGSTLTLEVKEPGGKKKKVTLTYRRASTVPVGPAFFPEGITRAKDIHYGKTQAGHGYIHLRRCPGDLPEQVDWVLGKLGHVPGLILDLRANGGGGFDHEELMGRFVPKGKTLAFQKTYPSAGSHPYGGPMVVIVDAGTRSAGETAGAIFKEDGRAYVIGETPTAGMSSQKKSIELPSRLFALYVSVHSNMGRSNDGRGLEGIGVIPHEIVEYDPADLAAGKDTLILRAEKLLANFPKDRVPYKSQ